MDAVEYLKANKRLCHSYVDCNECPLTGGLCDPANIAPEELVAIVEAWAKEHPSTTNAQKFAEVFGFEVFGSNITSLDPNWWHEEYKEPK